MAFKSWAAHVARLPDNKFTVTKNPLTASFTFPGFTVYSSERDGFIDITDVMWLADSALTFAKHYPYRGDEDRWINWADVRRNHLTFISSLEIMISRKLYDIHVPKWSLQAKVALGFIGKSTVTFPVELYVPGTQEALIRQTVQINGIDKTTRKSRPFPDWFQSQYEGQCSLKSGFRLESFSRPQQTFVYKREVMWAETDTNAHTNFTSYVRYALDGLHSALRQVSKDDIADYSPVHQGVKCENITASRIADVGSVHQTASWTPGVPSETTSAGNNAHFASTYSSNDKRSSSRALKAMSKDIVKQGLKMLRACYVNESLQGDVVDVHLWQEAGEEFTVRCSVEKGQQLICQIVLEYFSPLAKL